MHIYKIGDKVSIKLKQRPIIEGILIIINENKEFPYGVITSKQIRESCSLATLETYYEMEIPTKYNTLATVMQYPYGIFCAADEISLLQEKTIIKYGIVDFCYKYYKK